MHHKEGASLMNAYETENTIAYAREGFERLIDYVKDNAEKMDAHEMEEGIFKKLIPIGQAALKTYFAEKGTGDVGEEIQREDGVVLKREWGMRSRTYSSIFGEIVVPRTCYRRLGEAGIFPLDEAVNFPEHCYSYYLQEWMNMLSLDHPYVEGAKRLKYFFGISLVESVMATVSRNGAEHYDAFYEEKTAPTPEDERDFQVVSFDGKGVPMIKAETAKIQAKLGKGEKRQKTKEALVGVCYAVDKKERTAGELAEKLINPEQYHSRLHDKKQDEDEPRGENIRRIASIQRPKADVMNVIKNEAEQRDPMHTKPLVVLLDGALGLWNLATDIFGDWKSPVTYILDIIHVRDYLWDAANALHDEGSAAGRNWVQERMDQILQGKVGYVVGGLRQMITKRKLTGSKRKALEKAITYFEGHRKWMRYDEYLAAGMPIATGVVESACGSVVKKRMEGSGKRWSMEGAEAILLLRSLDKSDDYETYWPFHTIQERKRLYENSPKYSLIMPLANAA